MKTSWDTVIARSKRLKPIKPRFSKERQIGRAIALIDLKNQPDWSIKMHRAKYDMQGRKLCRLIPDGCVICESYKEDN